MNDQIRKHFQNVDPILFETIKQIGELEHILARNADVYFIALTEEIISQQLSGKVADVIFKRFIHLFPNQLITPEYLLTTPHESLRSVGMSNAKARFVKDLSQKVVSKELILEKLAALENEEVISELIKVHGIGRWTAEMFLMFSLGREDIFSHGDLGLKNAIKKLYNLPNPSKSDIEKLSLKWSPYRTYACRILWKSLEI